MNISFLNTTFLYFLPFSILFPIIIHLFFRRKPKRVVFSDLRFILLATKNAVPKRKLYNLLLLLVRCLIILLICLSFAKPVGYIGTLSSTKQNKQVLILLDCSYSMQYSQAGKSKLQIAIEVANSLIDLFLTGHPQTTALNKQISVVAFSNRIEAYIGFTNNKEHLKTFLRQLKATYRTTDIIPAL
ncbi:MAG: BatA and WFA domain-containing protein, partial [Elusimicrobiota bacterium]|nr:BatA and WFA domain-containing protein [Elusimicrobiota bacterium]